MTRKWNTGKKIFVQITYQKPGSIYFQNGWELDCILCWCDEKSYIGVYYQFEVIAKEYNIVKHTVYAIVLLPNLWHWLTIIFYDDDNRVGCRFTADCGQMLDIIKPSNLVTNTEHGPDLNSPHILPSQVSYGVSIVRNFKKKFHYVLTALHGKMK